MFGSADFLVGMPRTVERQWAPQETVTDYPRLCQAREWKRPPRSKPAPTEGSPAVQAFPLPQIRPSPEPWG